MAEVQVGQAAPEYPVPGSSGKEISLSDFRGQNIVLFFYPKDSTPG